MIKNLKKKQEGFTIIEVMIVLVIAAVILLIVFLAIPALQRNSRNTQRKNDVSAYLGAVAEWSNNSGGNVPSAATDLTAANTGVNALANTGFLTEPTAVLTGTQTNNASLGAMTLVTGATCAQTAGVNNGNSAASTSARSYVVLYAIENSSGGAVNQCQQS
jgi:type IV pilus assembly protein PilA